MTEKVNFTTSTSISACSIDSADMFTPISDYDYLVAALNELTRKHTVIRANLQAAIDHLQKLESQHAAEFQNNDVYEVNKRIERLELRIAELESLARTYYQTRQKHLDAIVFFAGMLILLNLFLIGVHYVW